MPVSYTHLDVYKRQGLEVVTDRIGNIFGIWETPENKDQAPLMIGSHIDTVINAGQFDGCLGVISSIEVIKTLKDNGCLLYTSQGITCQMLFF